MNFPRRWRRRLTALASALSLLAVTAALAATPARTPCDYAYEYYDRAAKARRALTCEAVSGLLREALSEGKADPVAFVWQVCEPDPHPGVLAWQAGNFPLGELTVARAAFYYEKPCVNWSYLDLRRWVVVNAAAARAEFMIDNYALAARLDQQHPRWREVQVETTAEQVGFRATITYGPVHVPFTVAGHLSVQPSERAAYHDLRLTIDAAKVGFVPVPRRLFSRLERAVNPLAVFSTSTWGLKPAEVRVLPPPQNAVVLTFASAVPQPKDVE